MRLSDYHEKLRPYIFHGVELNNDDTTATGSCPFCDAASKFSVKVDTGQYRCLRCEETGNAYSFIKRLYELSKEGTTTKSYALLAKSWGVTVDALQHFGLANSRLTTEWLIPGYNTKGTLANLYRIATRKDENGDTRTAPLGTPGMKPCPAGVPELLDNPYTTIWMVEGVKDACALRDMLIASPKEEQPSILAVPGCGNVSPDWFPLLEDKTVNICFDNDHPKRYGSDHEKAGELIKTKGRLVRPGLDGMERVITLLAKSKYKPTEVKCLFWNADGEHNPDLPDGYDLRDLHRDMEGDALAFVYAHLVRVDLPSSPKEKTSSGKQPAAVIKPIERTSFSELSDDWAAVLHFTPELKDTLAIMLAVVLSTESEKVNHIWLRVIGPPGSGKSTLAEAISVAREWISPKSIVTGFHSGFLDPSGEGKSSSLIPELDCKTIVMKDGDTLVNSPNRDRILSELRDLYDGTSRAHYRTGQQDEFEDIRMTFILCGTDELRSLNRTFLGERFLDCEIMKRGEDTSPYLRRATSNTYAALCHHLVPPKEEAVSGDRMLFLKQVTYGFIKHLKDSLRNNSFQVPHMDAAVDHRLQAMGQFVSLMRARKKDNHDDTTFRPRAELATRLCSQFTKLAFFLSIILGKDAIDAEAMRLVLKVVLDTALGLRLDICEAMSAEEYVGIRQLALSLDQPETTVRRTLDDMRLFNVAQPLSAPNNSGQRGRDRHLWQFTPTFNSIYKEVFNVGAKPQTRRGNPSRGRNDSHNQNKREQSTSGHRRPKPRQHKAK